jgi:hypothetical protein
MKFIFIFIFIFILHYCQHIYFLAGYLPPNIPWLALELDLGFPCHSGSNGLAGEYQDVLLTKE